MIKFDNTYANLPSHFYEEATPAQVPSPHLIRVNHKLAQELGINPDWLESPEGIAILAGNTVPSGAQPIAQAYAGHQFANFVPQLGDGRAILLGEVIHRDGKPRDLQLKGAGRTYFSRGGDGKSPLGPVIREYLMSEAMHALGVPTTRALAAVTTGEKVIREEAFDGAVFTRIASSHLRIGTFQYFAAQRDTAALEALTVYALKRHYSEYLPKDQPRSHNSALALLECVIKAQAELVAHWMSLGFIHGVMNTDNCTISGETIDYGPCAFIDDFHPEAVFSYIDRTGRYAWGNQPAIAHWNLTRLAEALLPILATDKVDAIKLAEKTLDTFSPYFQELYHERFCYKFGIKPETPTSFIQDSLALLAEQEVDFTLFFRHLTLLAKNENHQERFSRLFHSSEAVILWLGDWKKHHDPKSISEMRLNNPILIPRNHQVQKAIVQAYQGDYSHFQLLNKAWQTPFDEPENDELEQAPIASERVVNTFCGT